MTADRSRPESWERLARALGNRMVYHAYCADHKLSAAEPESCPFCADRAAYLRYERKAGKLVDPFADTPSISLADVRQSASIEFGGEAPDVD